MSEGFSIGIDHLVDAGATRESAEVVITFYESFFEAIGKAAFDGSAITPVAVRDCNGQAYVCPEGTLWEDLPKPIQRSWARAALNAGHAYRERIDQMNETLRLLEFRKAEDLGELPKASDESEKA